MHLQITRKAFAAVVMVAECVVFILLEKVRRATANCETTAELPTNRHEESVWRCPWS